MCCSLLTLVLWQLHLDGSSLLGTVSLVKVLVKLACPGPIGPYVKPYETLLLRGGAYCEGMPLVLGNGRDLDEHVVAWLVGEVMRAGNN